MDPTRIKRTCHAPMESLPAYRESARQAGRGHIANFYDFVEQLVIAGGKPSVRALGELPPAPLISCLMVTRNRAAIVARSVDSYIRQTYTNKELVMVADPSASMSELRSYIAGVGRDDIRLLDAGSAQSLGELRNRSLEFARGEVLCTWDDDDISHSHRLALQLEALVVDGSEASYIQDHFVYDASKGDLHWVDRGAPHFATAMFRRSALGSNLRAYPEVGTFSRLGEDVLFFFLRAKVSVLHESPALFIYVRHTNNTTDEGLVRHLLRSSRSVSERDQEFRDDLASVGLRTATVERNGAVYLVVV